VALCVKSLRKWIIALILPCVQGRLVAEGKRCEIGKHAGRPKSFKFAILGPAILTFMVAFGLQICRDAGQGAAKTTVTEIARLARAIQRDLFREKTHVATHMHRSAAIGEKPPLSGPDPRISSSPAGRNGPASRQVARAKADPEPGSRVTPSASSSPPSPLRIAISTVSISAGSSLDPPGLIWTPAVTLGGQIVTRGCKVDWTVMSGTAPVYAAAGSCSGNLNLSSVLGAGSYRLEAEAVLSGIDAYSAVNFQVGNKARTSSPSAAEFLNDQLFELAGVAGDLLEAVGLAH
jgi:hypothetical protein